MCITCVLFVTSVFVANAGKQQLSEYPYFSRLALAIPSIPFLLMKPFPSSWTCSVLSYPHTCLRMPLMICDELCASASSEKRISSLKELTFLLVCEKLATTFEDEWVALHRYAGEGEFLSYELRCIVLCIGKPNINVDIYMINRVKLSSSKLQSLSTMPGLLKFMRQAMSLQNDRDGLERLTLLRQCACGTWTQY